MNNKFRKSFQAFAKHEKKYQEDRLELQRSIKMRQRLQKEAEERAADSLLNPVNTHMSSMNMNINSSSSSRSSGSKSPIVIELQNKKIDDK